MSLVTIANFLQKTNEEKKDYLLSEGQLADFWLIGRVKNTVEPRPFFFIRELKNPYTGTSFVRSLFTDMEDPVSSVFCQNRSKKHLYNDETLVAFKVHISNNKEALAKGRILETTLDNIYVIDKPDEVFELVGIKQEDLKILALGKPDIYSERQSDFIDISKVIIENSIKDAKKIEEESRAKLQELTKKEKHLSAYKKEVEQQSREIIKYKQQLEELGFVFENNNSVIEEETTIEEPENAIELLDFVHQQLYARGYFYEKRTVRQLLAAVMTNEMIILSGPSGTGKTSIVKQIASIINAECEIIPVQPSWTDKQDLLGFYNPIRKLYVPTPFLDCLIEANLNPDKLYFICLDEMNLAQIEYYLADLLSVRELEENNLRLYSEFEYKQNMDEIKWYVQRMMGGQQNDISISEQLKQMKLTDADEYEMVMRYQNLQRYSSNISIPRNVRIIGTMNVDGDVQALSPKVIDRSFIIPLDSQENVESYEHVEKERAFIPASYFNREQLADANDSVELAFGLFAIQDQLSDWNIQFNKRLDKHVNAYRTAAQQFAIQQNELIDDLILMKFLPRVNEVCESDTKIEQLESQLLLYVNQSSKSISHIRKMKANHQKTSLFSYWS